MKKIEVEINGQRMFGGVARSGSTTWYSLNGEVWTIEDESRVSRGGAKSRTADASMVAAPMPGKIIKVFVKPGDTVTTGDTLVVMEAMKMEYTLKAAASGVVEEISTDAGRQVTLGSVLVRLKLSSPKEK